MLLRLFFEGGDPVLASLFRDSGGQKRRRDRRMRHFEGAIGHVVVANERTAIGPNGHGCILTDLASIVQGGGSCGQEC